MGTTVIIADNNSGPDVTTNPGLLFSKTKPEAVPCRSVILKPEKAPKGRVSVIVSEADSEGCRCSDLKSRGTRRQ